MTRRRNNQLAAHDIATEIVRRVAAANAKTGGGYVVRLSRPPTPSEQPQLMAARLERRPIAIIPHKCTREEWIRRYAQSAIFHT